jgi:small-conductance mechanosensitive channel
MHIIKQQNKIIDNLSKEIVDLKERLKQEQKDRFKLAIELEQFKRSRFNLHQKSDKAVMTNFDKVILIR